MRLIFVVLATLTLEWQGLVLEDMTYWALITWAAILDCNELRW
jgi:hypothetical protein